MQDEALVAAGTGEKVPIGHLIQVELDVEPFIEEYDPDPHGWHADMLFARST